MARDLICDFCSKKGLVTVEIPAEDFVHEKSQVRSDGAWLACDICAQMVRTGQGEQLVKRAVDTFLDVHPEQVEQRGWLTGEIRKLHMQFWSAVSGPAVELTEERRAMYEEEAAVYEAGAT